MKILDLIYQQAQKPGLEFLLIGGHAINTIGDRRQTRDIDLLVCMADKAGWQKLLSEMGYQEFNVSDSFMQFTPSDPGEWPVDLVLVDQVTFIGLKNEASQFNLGGEHNVLIPSAIHLIAMKLHALKQGNPQRRIKDLLDIVTLICCTKMDVENETLKNLCKKYGSPEIYEEIINACGKSR